MKKQKDEFGEFFILPANNNIGDYAEWEEVPEGLLLKNVKIKMWENVENNL